MRAKSGEWSNLRLRYAFVLIALGFTQLYSQDPLTLNPGQSVYRVGKHVAYLEDPLNSLEIDDIVAAAASQRFTLSKTESLNFGHTSSAFWLMFRLQPQAEESENVPSADYILDIGYPQYQEITLYVMTNIGTVDMRLENGLNTHWKGKLFQQPDYFSLPSISQSTLYFLRMTSGSSMAAPIRLWEHQAYARHLLLKRLLLGIYYGILAAMLLYNLFLFWVVRDKTYIYYVLYVFCYGIYQFAFDGLAALYMPNANPEMGITVMVAMGLISLSFGLQFTRSFLQLKEIAAIFDRAVLGIALFFPLYISLIFILPANVYNRIGNLITPLFSITLITAGILALPARRKLARLFLAAAGAFAIGMFIRILRNTGVLPANIITTYAVHYGSVIEMILLSLGLGARINTLRAERDQAYNSARDQLASNLHDEVGSTLSGIMLFANAMDKVGDEQEKQRFIGKIKQSAIDAQERMRDLLWTINPANDSWDVLLAKMQRFASDLFDSLEIQYDIDFPERVSLKNLDVEQRQHFWLIYKEIVNNIAKHANTNYAHIGLSIHGHTVKLLVLDRGIGFDGHTKIDSYGIENIYQRAAKLGGTAELDSAPGEGTKWSLKFSV